jgi:tetratricopeptide (TPR) repeat protein
MLSSLLGALKGKAAAPGLAEPFARAREALQDGDLPAAENQFLALTARAPDNAECWLHAGLCAARRGDHAGALERVRRARALDPTHPVYLYHEAVALAELGRTDEAITAGRAASRADGGLVDAHKLTARLMLPGPDYLAFLERLHHHLAPANYVEIGVNAGLSFRFVRPGTPAIGVDPAPIVDYALAPGSRIVAATSDAFFAANDIPALLGGPVALAFIDGMHRFEFALRDFIALERVAASGATVLVHDCLPLDRASAERERCTTFWSGDVWRLILALRKYRPDLAVHTLALAPTGLGMIRRLDPGSTVLSDNYDAIVAEFLALDYSVLEADPAGLLNLFPNDWERIVALLEDSPP